MDLDGDGIPDLISGSWPGEIFFFKGKGKGDFEAPVKIKDKKGKSINIGGGRRDSGDMILVAGDATFETTDKGTVIVYEGERIAVPKDKEGKAFVGLKRGDVYKLRLHNADRIEAATSVTIDGVDAFEFYEPQKSRPTSFLIPPGGVREVKGWPRGTGSHNEFLVGSYSQSAAAKHLRSNAKLGTITVCFFPCWTGKTPPSEYGDARSTNENAERASPNSRARASGSRPDATGRRSVREPISRSMSRSR